MSDVTAVLSILLSITRGALLTAGLILLVRVLLHKVLSAKAKYYLWLLLALRLVLPVVPESPVSLMNFLPDRTAAQQAPSSPAAPDAPINPDAVLWEGNPEIAPEGPEIPNTAVAADLSGAPGVVEEFPEAPAAPAAPTAPSIPGTTILFWGWLAGAGLVLAVYGTLYMITAIRLKRLPVCTDSDTLRVFLHLSRVCGIRGDIRLVSGGAGMLGGVFRSTIVLPVERHGEDVAPIIVHELLHYKYRDLRLFALFRILTAIYWFNPVVWLCFHWAKYDCEAACDQRVLETGLVPPASYAEALYEEGQFHTKRRPLMQTTFGGDRHSLKRRIQQIANFRSPKTWGTVLVVVLAVLVAACTMTRASSKAEIREAIIGAEATNNAFTAYESDRLGTAGLSETELQAQLDAYNNAIDRYFSSASSYRDLKDRHEWYLREAYYDPEQADYTVSLSILTCDIKWLWVTGSTAKAKAEVVSYFNEIRRSPADDANGAFHILCGAQTVTLPYNLVREDGLWKVQNIEISGEPWSRIWSADIDGTYYDTFEEALAAARSVDLAGLEEMTKHWNTDIPELLPLPDNLHHQIFSDTAAVANVQAEFARYMESLQPPGGIYGLSFDEHVQQGLLDPAAGTVEHYTRDDCDLTYSLFRTTIELGGQTVPIDYNFSQTVLSDEEILTQVFVTPPEDVPIDTWLESISDPWLSGLTQNTDLNGWEWNTAEYVADFLTEEQLQTVIDAQLAMGQTCSSSEFPQTAENAEHTLKTRWRVVTAFSSGPVDEDSKLVWQFNGTGAALIAAVQKGGTDMIDTSILEDTPSPSAAAVTPPSYGHSDLDGFTYESTMWGMTPEAVLASENLLAEDFPLLNRGKNYSMEGPVSGHPEVKQVEFEFHFTDLELTLGLDRVQVDYDPELITYEELLSLRRSQFGPSTTIQGDTAQWELKHGWFTLTLTKNGFLRETTGTDHGLSTEDAAEQIATFDAEEYLASLQPPNGHYGWTYEQHVAAGLLDPEQGSLTLEQDTQAGRAHAFATRMELGGETVDAVYVFSTTMATIDGSGKEVLTQVMVTPPEGVALSQWVAKFSDSFTDKLYESQNLTYKSPLSVGSLLPEAQQEEIMDAFRAHNDGNAVSLGGWPLVQNWYQQNARIWHFNGTGAALYLTAQTLE